MATTGQCLCGAVKYEIAKLPARTGVCHCKNCQRQAGSAFSTIGAVPKTELTLTAAEPKLYEDGDTASGRTVQRYFCVVCGSPIYSVIASRPGTVFIKTGTMDDTSAFEPQFHLWCESKQDWVTLGEGVPTMARGVDSKPPGTENV